MHRTRGTLIAAALCWTASAFGQQYPLVYGPTGHPYGPTQAAYQYERQYGRPWHGYGGRTAGPTYSGSHAVLSNGYGSTWSGWGPGYVVPYVIPGPVAYAPAYYGNFGVIYGEPPVTLGYPSYGVLPPPSVVAPQNTIAPAWPAPGMTDPQSATMLQNQLQWGDALPVVKPEPAVRAATPTSTEAKLKSLEAQTNGDHNLRQQKWTQAYADYRRAVQLADDRAEAHLRLGLTLIALQNFDTAAVEIKRAVAIDPNITRLDVTLSKLFGPGSELARSSIAHKLLNYVQTDIRDPDRLLLMGVWLHFDQDPRAAEVLETGLRISNGARHFAAFLQPAPNETYIPQSTNPKSAGPPATQAPVPAPAPAPTLPPAPLPDNAPANTEPPRLFIPSE